MQLPQELPPLKITPTLPITSPCRCPNFHCRSDPVPTTQQAKTTALPEPASTLPLCPRQWQCELQPGSGKLSSCHTHSPGSRLHHTISVRSFVRRFLTQHLSRCFGLQLCLSPPKTVYNVIPGSNSTFFTFILTILIRMSKPHRSEFVL
jgi:hypothetical protein